ncbi:unnamed protein product [Ectocarpus sp. 8 AP-2014]
MIYLKKGKSELAFRNPAEAHTVAAETQPAQPSPIAEQVTDYPRSLALWAGTTDGARLAEDEAEREQYWASFREAIRQAEHRLGQQQEQRDAVVQATEQEEEAQRADDGRGDVTTAARPLSECRSQARYGAGPDMVRMGKEYTADELLQIVPQVFGVRPAAGSQELWLDRRYLKVHHGFLSTDRDENVFRTWTYNPSSRDSASGKRGVS